MTHCDGLNYMWAVELVSPMQFIMLQSLDSASYHHQLHSSHLIAIIILIILMIIFIVVLFFSVELYELYSFILELSQF